MQSLSFMCYFDLGTELADVMEKVRDSDTGEDHDITDQEGADSQYNHETPGVAWSGNEGTGAEAAQPGNPLQPGPEGCGVESGAELPQGLGSPLERIPRTS